MTFTSEPRYQSTLAASGEADLAVPRAADPLRAQLLHTLQRHGTGPAALADVLANAGRYAGEVASILHELFGNHAVSQAEDLLHARVAATSATATAPSAPVATAQPRAATTKPTPAPAIDRATALLELSLQHLGVVETTLLPSFRRAVDAMDPAGADALATALVGGLYQIEETPRRIAALVPEVRDVADLDANGPRVSTADSDPFAHDPAAIATLQARQHAVSDALAKLLPRLAVELSPQRFAGQTVLGAIETPPPLALQAGLSYVAFEARQTVALLEDAAAIEAMLAPVSREGEAVGTPDTARQAALTKVWLHRGRPVSFLFLVRVLTQKGLWQQLESSKSAWTGGSGHDLARKVQQQAGETGGLADVGTFDLDSAREALHTGVTDWAVSDADAMHVFTMIRSADPEARNRLVTLLHRQGQLGRLCENLPWRSVQALFDAVSDAEARQLLLPFWYGKGGGESLGQTLTRKTDEQLAEGHPLRAFGPYFLNFTMDALTFGGKPIIDQAHEQRAEGFITSDAYWTAVAKASARTAAVATAALVSGGAGGAFSEGFAGTLGASQGVAQLAGTAAGGAIGGVGAHVVGDVYDQLLLGKQGFDSLASYGKEATSGALTGLLLGGVAAAGAKFLPRSANKLQHNYQARHPEMMEMLAAARAAGSGAAFRVRMTVQRWLSIGGGGGGLGGGMQPAYAGSGAAAADLRALPPETELWITARPLGDLEAPMARLDDEAAPWFEVESVEVRGRAGRSGTRDLDSYGEDASYVDDAADWRSDGDSANLATHADDIGTAEPSSGGALSERRIRHVPGRAMDAEMSAEHGISILDEARLGITRPPRHHTLPQEEIKFFQERGFPGRDIDKYCIEMSTLDHEMLHGGNQSLARQHWKQQEWSTELMRNLRSDEVELQLREGPKAKLSREMILRVVEKMRVRFNIADRNFIDYRADDVMSPQFEEGDIP